jgi:probable F420-dependent oxidoreductase
MNGHEWFDRVGVWGKGPWLDPAKKSEARDAAAEVEEIGFGSLWVSGGHEGTGVPDVFGNLLAGTRSLTIASGIISIWRSSTSQTAKAAADLESLYPSRFILGLGVSHRARVEALGRRFDRPYSATADYLDELDQRHHSEVAVSKERRVLAALGPRMSRLAGARAAGMHSYFVPVAHTAASRRILGEKPLLVPELAVVLEKDASKARTIARAHMSYYLSLPHYVDNLRRLGWAEDDVQNGGSDRLIDAIVASGGPEAIRARVNEHRAAGANTVLLQVLSEDQAAFPLGQLRELAPALAGNGEG